MEGGFLMNKDSFLQPNIHFYSSIYTILNG